MFIWTNLKLPYLIYFLLYLVMMSLHRLNWSPGMHSHQKIALNFILWIKTVSEDEWSKFKRLKMLSETKCSKSFQKDFF